MAIDCIAVDELGRAPEFVDGCEQSSMCQRFSLDNDYPPSELQPPKCRHAPPPESLLARLKPRRSDGILALAAPFHTHCELKAEFSTPWRNGNPESFGLEGRCTDFWAGPR
jgi:hypothetical protein